MRQIKVTDDLTYEQAEQMFLTLINESARGEEMRRLYHYLKECDALMDDIRDLNRELDKDDDDQDQKLDS